MGVTKYYSEESSKYSEISLQGEGTLYLSFRDLELLIHQHFGDISPDSLCALDYGCGAGRSTRYLKSLGIDNVDGFDISKNMIEKAKKLDSKGSYKLIQSPQLPVDKASYDLAVLSFVTVALESEEKLLSVFQEIARALKPGGQLLIITLSEEFWNPHRKWLSYKQDYPENYSLVCGQNARLFITSCSLELTDCFWSEMTVNDVTAQAGFSLEKIHKPLGKLGEGIDWQDELKHPPYSIFNLRKRNSL